MFKYFKSDVLFQLAFVLITIGLLYSRFLISLGMIVFLISGISNYTESGKFKGFINNRYYLYVTIIFFLFFISGLWSEDVSYFFNRMRIKLPFLFLPLAFYWAPKLSRHILHRLMLFFVATIVFSVLWSLLMFLKDYNYYTSIYGKGQILPTPIHHIRYSLLVVSAFLMCIYILSSKTFLLYKNESKVLAGISLLLVIYLHVLAVRSGLLALYAVVGGIILHLLFQKQYKKFALPIFLLSTLAIFIAVNFVPTVKNKIGYMKYSLELFAKNENIRELSDSRRLGSIYAGLQLMREYPLTGVGIGDIMNETNAYLEKNYPELTNLELLPHNQYVLTGAAIGIIGMIIFIICSLLPLFYLSGWNDILLIGSQLILVSSFMVEHTIESQIGVAAYLFILLFAMKNLESKPLEHA